MKNVNSTIKELLSKVDMEEAMQLWLEEEKKRQIRVTVPLDKLTFLRLEYVIKRLDISKAEFIREILVASLSDIESEWNLSGDSGYEHISNLIKESESKRLQELEGKVVEE